MFDPRSCRDCGGEFQPLAPNQVYCGSPCRSPYMAVRKGGTCRGCGAHLEDGRNRYCSDACRPAKPAPKLRSVAVPRKRACGRCGAIWSPSSSRTQTDLCPGCREADRDAHVYSTDRAWRKAIRSRANGLCEDCGASERDSGAYHHAHHVVHRAEGGLSTLANGRLLCVDCHDAIHGGNAVGGALLHRGSASALTDEDVERIARRVVDLLHAETLIQP